MITVIGLDGGPLAPEAQAALAEATCVVGAARHIDAVAVPERARRLTLGRLDVAVAEVVAATGPVVVLASGDPGFFGIVRALRAAGAHPRVLPAVSSVALAFARIGLTWDDALVVSAHGRNDSGRSARRALAAALGHSKAAILTAPGHAEPEAFLPALGDAGRDVYVAECLGTPQERVTHVAAGADLPAAGPGTSATEESPPGAWRHPNVVLAVRPDRRIAPAMGWLPGHQGAPDGWALPPERFEHRASMITKPEVRAVALARLAPRPGTVVWDIGAGSGSVAVECARFGARAIAFERNDDDCARIRANAATHGMEVEVRPGDAPTQIRTAPPPLPPDAVFIGGGGTEAVTAVLTAGRPARVVIALAALDRVRPAYDVLIEHDYEVAGTQLHASRLAALPDGSLRLAATNPVTLLWGYSSGGAEGPDESG
ncbi:precorrin-6y C5,15-methyltransferase (decarboxylating) subunit CbiE [Salinactinospora qingdaonensis]|uniref:Bifunctional cobalt-precorrin-7 (C(5))-methyltransferase/cobalt-precorrin-6B (C(15))-methyltransferase n=1 Tax=Salinactinospora qingdaonensis TaxID=702744 RepID=A0ABP7EZD9_9ACTN